MSDNLYYLGAGDQLRVMPSGDFPSEDDLQGLLERHPALLTDAHFGEGEPRRWVLVRREAGIADQDGNPARWSLDHLYLDQDGVPTLVEVKRAVDTRARREVVAQMLDYAANAVLRCRIEQMIEWFAEGASKAGITPSERLSDLLQISEPNEEGFWQQVDANMRSGRIRMLFVADQIYPELQRIVEFLNEQMRPATVAALELRQYVSGVDKIIAPRVLGFTQRAVQAKNVRATQYASSLDEWFEKLNKENTDKAKAIISLFSKFGGDSLVAYQSVAVEFYCTRSTGKDGLVRPFYVRGYGKYAISLYMMRHSQALASEEARLLLLAELKNLGLPYPSADGLSIKGEREFAIPALDDENGWKRVEQIIRLVTERLAVKSNGTNL
ncbi:hypothetical protein [Xanthobacter flavus]|uniref:hypothetical protein n=1 Tax=Xanthobacter flavus TaxID=281 RepID=UPI00372A4B95